MHRLLPAIEGHRQARDRLLLLLRHCPQSRDVSASKAVSGSHHELRWVEKALVPAPVFRSGAGRTERYRKLDLHKQHLRK